MNKIALCLYGNFNNRFSDQSGLNGFEYIKNKILDGRNIDIFIHSWDTKNQATIISLYNKLIKNSIIEQQINFSSIVDEYKINRDLYNPAGGEKFRNIENSLSFYYSRGKSIELKQDYEIKNNFKYEIVICSRFDLGQIDKYNGYQDFKVSEITFNESLDMNYIYSAMWDQFNAGMTDMWYYSSSENIDILKSMYEKALTYYQANSTYLKALTTGWPDSNALDPFSNEIFQKEKSKNLIRYKIHEGQNNHFMHKWFFIESGLYAKSKFLSITSNKFCILTNALNSSLEKINNYLENQEKHARWIGNRYILTELQIKTNDQHYETIQPQKLKYSDILLESLLKIQKSGYEFCLIDSAEDSLNGLMDYHKIKSAMKFVMKPRKGKPFRNGFDCIELDKTTSLIKIRTISDSYIYWTPLLWPRQFFIFPSLWKINTLVALLKVLPERDKIDLQKQAFWQCLRLKLKCGYIYEDAHNSGLNNVYPRKKV